MRNLVSKHFQYSNRYSTSQTTFQESMILSSFLSSWNLLSSKGLDKDIDELFIGSHMGNHNVSLYGVVSQKMVLDINVFGTRMFFG
jgi:hypothetical protein